MSKDIISICDGFSKETGVKALSEAEGSFMKHARMNRAILKTDFLMGMVINRSDIQALVTD